MMKYQSHIHLTMIAKEKINGFSMMVNNITRRVIISYTKSMHQTMLMLKWRNGSSPHRQWFVYTVFILKLIVSCWKPNHRCYIFENDLFWLCELTKRSGNRCVFIGSMSSAYECSQIGRSNVELKNNPYMLSSLLANFSTVFWICGMNWYE